MFPENVLHTQDLVREIAWLCTGHPLEELRATSGSLQHTRCCRSKI